MVRLVCSTYVLYSRPGCTQMVRLVCSTYVLYSRPGCTQMVRLVCIMDLHVPCGWRGGSLSPAAAHLCHTCSTPPSYLIHPPHLLYLPHLLTPPPPTPPTSPHTSSPPPLPNMFHTCHLPSVTKLVSHKSQL